jgi:hypothetical protein
MPRVSLTIVQPVRPLVSDDELDQFIAFVPPPVPDECDDEGEYLVRRRNERGDMQSYNGGSPVCTDCGDRYFNSGGGECCDICEEYALRLWGDFDPTW